MDLEAEQASEEQIDRQFRSQWAMVRPWDVQGWLLMWAAIGWMARTDIVLRAVDRFAMGAIEGMRTLQQQLDNQRVDLAKLAHKLRS